MPTTTPTQLYAAQAKDPNPQFIDVRTPAEFEEVHAVGAVNIPLGEFRAAEVISNLGLSSDKPVYMICKMGGRSQKACDALASAGLTNVVNVSGGTDAWIVAGLPVAHGAKPAFAIMRQVQLLAGSVALTGALLSFLNPMWAILPAFIGAGFIFSGLTNTCGMGAMLSKMPWNQTKAKNTETAAATCDTGG